MKYTAIYQNEADIWKVEGEFPSFLEACDGFNSGDAHLIIIPTEELNKLLGIDRLQRIITGLARCAGLSKADMKFVKENFL